MTAAPPTRVLVADDQSYVLDALRLLFRGAGYDGEFVSSPHAVLERIARGSYDLLLLDLNYTRDTTSGGEGLDLISRLRDLDAVLPIVVMTGWGSVDTAVEAMRRGARSFVQKPWDNQVLLDVIGREIESARRARRRDAEQAREHRDACVIQRSLLPKALPRLDGVRVAAEWRPAGGYGGDWYDAVQAGPHGLGISIADVCGKGLPAALIMANLQAAVRAFAQDDSAPGEVCGRVNRLLCDHMVNGRFVTFCHARLKMDDRVLTYANAGHNPPVVVRATGEAIRLADAGTVLGVFPDTPYGTASVPLAVGDRIVLFTDGIVEASAADGEEFGDERLIRLVRTRGQASPDDIVAAIFDAVTRHAGGPLQDDATAIVAAVDA